MEIFGKLSPICSELPTNKSMQESLTMCQNMAEGIRTLDLVGG